MCQRAGHRGQRSVLLCLGVGRKSSLTQTQLCFCVNQVVCRTRLLCRVSSNHYTGLSVGAVMGLNGQSNCLLVAYILHSIDKLTYCNREIFRAAYRMGIRHWLNFVKNLVRAMDSVVRSIPSLHLKTMQSAGEGKATLPRGW